jgi:nicotinate-nucleotide adenylyltransferase
MAGEAAYRQLGLDVVTFLPAGDPWQKADREVTPAEHRWAMMQAAVGDVPYFDVDRRELDRDGRTYTIDTLESFGDDDVILILGADAAARVPTWHRAEDVLARCRIAVVPRRGTSRTDVADAIGDGFDWLHAIELPLSSTVLRSHARAGGSLRFLVRDRVWDYVRQHQVYGGACR